MLAVMSSFTSPVILDDSSSKSDTDDTIWSGENLYHKGRKQLDRSGAMLTTIATQVVFCLAGRCSLVPS